MNQTWWTASNPPPATVPPRLRELDAVWARRVAVVAVACWTVGLTGGAGIGLLVGPASPLTPWGWGLTVTGGALLLSAAALSLALPHHRGQGALRNSVRAGSLPTDPIVRWKQDQLAATAAVSAWPLLLAAPGMVLVIWPLFLPGPVVLAAWAVISVWATWRISTVFVARRYYQLSHRC